MLGNVFAASTWLDNWARTLLGAALFTNGVGKWFVPYRATFAIPEWCYYLGSGFEIILAVGYVARPLWSAYGTLALSIGGSLLSVIHDGDCG